MQNTKTTDGPSDDDADAAWRRQLIERLANFDAPQDGLSDRPSSAIMVQIQAALERMESNADLAQGTAPQPVTVDAGAPDQDPTMPPRPRPRKKKARTQPTPAHTSGKTAASYLLQIATQLQTIDIPIGHWAGIAAPVIVLGTALSLGFVLVTSGGLGGGSAGSGPVVVTGNAKPSLAATLAVVAADVPKPTVQQPQPRQAAAPRVTQRSVEDINSEVLAALRPGKTDDGEATEPPEPVPAQVIAQLAPKQVAVAEASQATTSTVQIAQPQHQMRPRIVRVVAVNDATGSIDQGRMALLGDPSKPGTAGFLPWEKPAQADAETPEVPKLQHRRSHTRKRSARTAGGLDGNFSLIDYLLGPANTPKASDKPAAAN